MVTNQAIKDFLSYLESVRGYSEKTIISYRHDLMRLEEYLEKHSMNYDELTFQDAKDFALNLYDQKLSKATINRILSALKSFYTNLYETSQIESNPFDRVIRAKQTRSLPTVLSHQEIESILNYPVTDYDSLTEVTMFNMFYSTGCRLSELINMNIKDMDIDHSRVLVRGKGNKQRYVFLTDRAKSFLNLYLPEREKVLERNNVISDILLLNSKAKQLPLSSVHVIFDKYRDKLNLTKKFTPHVFRHTFATHLLDNSSDIRVVQVLLGHESIGTTQIYTHITSKRLENVYDNAHPHSGKKNKEN